MVANRLPLRRWRRTQAIAGVFVRHGFGFVIEQLEPGWGKAHSTPPENLALHFRLALEELGPAFIKLGQILSTRPDLLPPAYLAELGKLQDTIPPLPWETIRAVLVEEMGCDPEQAFSSIDPIPMAAASLGQVHSARLPGGEEVVVKVQRPGIRAVIETDLEILAALADRAQATRWGQVYDFPCMAEEFAYTLRNELDYRREGRNADRFRENFSGETFLVIPRVYWSSPRVLVMERIQGIKIDDIPALEAAGYNRHRIAVNSARIIITAVLEDGFFHADPHPGNYRVLPGEVIGVMDFGMVGSLSERERRDLIRLYLVAAALDADGIVDQLVQMGAASGEVDRAGLGREISRLLGKYYSLSLKDIHARQVVEEIMPVAFRYHLRLPGDLGLLAKTLTMIEGIGVQLDPEFDLFAVAQPFVRRLVWRMLAPGPGWARDVLLGGAAWGELANRLPRAGNRVLERIERGEGLKIHLDAIDRLERRLEWLSWSVLGGALLIALAVLAVQAFPGDILRGVVVVLLALGAGGCLVTWRRHYRD
ncbi:MAG: AarF/ABC1/UbiB kinase family protein [Anaerolineaceae bacterium]|nr:AarF/ABC1/UbiB kinase family protein [Anaerolineaceae bacterium]